MSPETPRVAINGLGRIGRSLMRINETRTPDTEDRHTVRLGENNGLNIVAVNDLTPLPAMAHLLRRDSVHGAFPGEVEVDNEGQQLIVNGHRIAYHQERDPSKLPWGDLDVDAVIEATGVFRQRSQAAGHLEAGAERVLLTVPGKPDQDGTEVDNTVVFGVNEDDPRDEVVSLASCTTNAAGPLLKVILEEIGEIQGGVLRTTHAYTNDQNLGDGPHSDVFRARAAAENIIPTGTGASVAVGKIMPELAGKLIGNCDRVPVPDGSILHLDLFMKDEQDPEKVRKAIQKAALGRLKGILAVTNDPLVSRDIIGRPESSIVPTLLLSVRGQVIAVSSWYDNEWGYSNRVWEWAVGSKG
ncbi:MAG: type I glyceraldehyde-3-phosphate dehydrogenase [bacterium]|nr:type I glyceraldehyde-3-phosphate dehydrogenase [bacterium]